VMPDHVDALITLDGLVPSPQDDAQFVHQMHDSIRYTARIARQAQRRFSSLEDFIERRQRYGVSRDIAARLAARAVEETADGFVLRNDQRLHSPSAIKLNARQIEAALRALSVPVLTVWASEGLLTRDWDLDVAALAETAIGDLTSVSVDGHHHCHMEPEKAAEIARHILYFFGRVDKDTAEAASAAP